MIAATMPPRMARAAVSAGAPPICCDTAMAMGVVTALGAMDSATSREPPRAQTIATPLTMEVTDPASSARPTPGRLRRTCARFFASGIARAMVAGPSRKLMNCAPAK